MPQPCDVSVVIPVHNGESFVGAAIDSALAQTGHSTQVIVVDNNSTDGTLHVVSELMRTDHGGRIILIREARPNAANARNAGARLATGTWLAFLDADDIWLPEKLQRQMEARRLHPEADLVFTLGEEFHSEQLRPEQRASLPCRPEPYPMLTLSSLLLKREVFVRVGDLPDVPTGEFFAWYGWARELGLKDYVVPEVLVRRRIHAHNTTRGGGAMAGYPLAAKWLLDRRREATAGRRQATAIAEAIR
jgi:glycosyltransferase involved in cell wall biosynthesis